MRDGFYTHIKSRIIATGRDARYSLDAYELVASSLSFYRMKNEAQGHLSASTIVSALGELAVTKFGPLAKTVLSETGIHTPVDVGNIIYNLIDIDLFSKDEDDSLDEFYECNDIFEGIDREACFSINRERIKKVKES
jgi:uncharacterized repeat protein (TIGR04138 family)